jgi:hypothetical protein
MMKRRHSTRCVNDSEFSSKQNRQRADAPAHGAPRAGSVNAEAQTIEGWRQRPRAYKACDTAKPTQSKGNRGSHLPSPCAKPLIQHDRKVHRQESRHI